MVCAILFLVLLIPGINIVTPKLQSEQATEIQTETRESENQILEVCEIFNPSQTYEHPLSSNVTTIAAKDEIAALVGENIYKSIGVPNPIMYPSCWIYDDTYDVIDRIGPAFGEHCDIAMGNLDDDVALEMIITGRDVNTRIYDDASTNFTELHECDYGGQCSVAAGDFDGDGRDEIVLYKADFIVLDDALSNFTELVNTDDYYYGFPDDIDNLYLVTVGNFDNDVEDEIVIYVRYNQVSYGTSFYYRVIAIDGDFSTMAQIGYGGNYGEMPIAITTGDFDADGLDEIVYMLGFLYYVDDAEADTPFAELSYLESYGGSGTYYYFHHMGPGQLAAGNFDNDEEDEIVVIHFGTSNNQAVLREAFFEFGEADNSFSLMSVKLESVDSDDEIVSADVATGNFDIDSQSEIALFYLVDPESGNNVLYYDVRDDELANWDILENGEIEYYGEGEEYYHYPAIATGDLDGDGMTLQYTGIVNNSISDPHIIVAMAAAPTVTGINQNYQQTRTTYGTDVSQSEAESNGYTVSSAISYTFKAEDPFGVFSAEASAIFSNEFSMTGTHTTSVSFSTSYSADYSDNYIIFDAVTYRNYYYEIIDHGNQDLVGEIISINVPMESTIYKWTATYFNANNGNTPDIGSETFDHSVGEVWTYPSTGDRDAILDQWSDKGSWKSRKAMAVGQGGGTNEIGIYLNNESTTESQRTVGTEFSASFLLGGIGAGYTSGFFGTEAYSVTIGESTAYEGVVGDIDSVYYGNYSYSFGLFVYNLYRNDTAGYGCNYQVIDYWVEGYNGPHATPTTPYNPYFDFISKNAIIITIVIVGIMIVGAICIRRR